MKGVAGLQGHSPTEHEDGAGGGIIGQRQRLLKAQLLATAVEAIRAVDALGVVVAAGAVLHGLQLLRALLGEKVTGRLWPRRWQFPSHPLLPPSEMVHELGIDEYLTNSSVALDTSLYLP